MNEITTNNNQLAMWEDQDKLNQMKNMVAKNLDNNEFALFVEIGKALNLNPFLRQMWAVKFGGQAQIFVGRDGYLVNATRDPRYEGCQSDGIYTNDVITEGNNGTLIIRHNWADMGQLIAGYAVVFVTGRKPTVRKVLRSEFDKKQNNWKSMPETMIKKVAEAQALRFAFPDLFSGTYHESEQWKEESKTQTITSNTNTSFAPEDEIEVEPVVEKKDPTKGIATISAMVEQLTDEQLDQYTQYMENVFGGAELESLDYDKVTKIYRYMKKELGA